MGLENDRSKEGGGRRINDPREEIGMHFCLTGRIVRSQMMWAGHLVRMEVGRLPKRAEVVKQRGRRKKGRSQLRWEDCVKRDVKKKEDKKSGGMRLLLGSSAAASVNSRTYPCINRTIWENITVATNLR